MSDNGAGKRITIPAIWVNNEPPPRNSDSSLSATEGAVCLIEPNYNIVKVQHLLSGQAKHYYEWQVNILWYGSVEDVQARFFEGIIATMRLKFENFRETIQVHRSGQPRTVTYRLSDTTLVNLL